MNMTVPVNTILQPLLGLSARKKKWIADRLYESVKEDKTEAEKEKAMIMADIREALIDIKEGRTFPAEELIERLKNE